MSGTVAEGFVLGLSMGGTCAAVCGPFLAPYLLTEGGLVTLSRRLAVFVEFLSGRLAAYLGVAVVAGLTGRALGGFLTPRIEGSLLFAAAVLLAWFSARNLTGRPRSLRGLKCVVPARGFTFVSGFLLGINLCPPFVVAFTRALGLGGVVVSAMFFIALFLGTTVCMLPLPFIAAFLRAGVWRRAGAYLGLIAGAWFAVQGLSAWF